MNKIYKVIWSKAKHCYVVASEIAKSHSKSGSATGMKKLLLATLAAATLSCTGFSTVDAVWVKASDDEYYNVQSVNDAVKTDEAVSQAQTTANQAVTVAVNAQSDASKALVTAGEASKDAAGALSKVEAATSEVKTAAGDAKLLAQAASNKADAVEKELTDYYNKAETNALITREQEDRRNAIDTDIATEVANRNEAITNAFKYEENARNQAITYAKIELQQKIIDEATARKETEEALEQKVTTEVAALGEVDKALDKRVTTNEGDITKLQNKTAGIERADDAEGEYNTIVGDKLIANKDATFKQDVAVAGTTTTDTLIVTGDTNLKNAKVDGFFEVTDISTFKHEAIFEKGLDANGEKITKVGDGRIAEDSTDAVNGRQLYTEQQERIDADSALSERISTLARDGEYIKQVNTVSGNLRALDDGLIAEKAVREEADTAEAAARKDADSVLSERISTLARDGEYIKQVNTVSGNLRALDDGLIAEKAAREEADTAEAIARKDADSALSERISTLARDGEYIKQVNTVSGNLRALDNGLIAEKAAREEADTAEATARKDADSTLSDRIGSQWEDGSYIKASADTVNGYSSVYDNLRSLDTALKETDERTEGITRKEAGTQIEGQVTVDREGNISGVKKLSAESIETTGGADIGGDLTVKGEATFEKGLDANGEKITKVGDGRIAEDSTDAVNGRQLYTEQQARIDADSTLSDRIGSQWEDGSYIKASADTVNGYSSVYDNLRSLDTALKETDDRTGGITRKEAVTQIEGQVTVDREGNISDVKKLSAASIETTGGADIGGGLTVKGESIFGDKATFNNGIDVSAGKTSLKVEDGSIIEKLEDENGNHNDSSSTATDSHRYMTNGTQDSYSGQQANGMGTIVRDTIANTNTHTEQTAENITFEAKDGTIKNDTKNLINNATETITNTAGTSITDKVSKNTRVLDTEGITDTVGDTSFKQRIEKILMNVGENSGLAIEKEAINIDSEEIIGTATDKLINQVKNGDEVMASIAMDENGDVKTAAKKNITNEAEGDIHSIAKNITNTAEETLTHKAKDIVNEASGSVTTAVKVRGEEMAGTEMDANGNINTTAKKTITTSARELINKAVEKITDTVGDDENYNTVESTADGGTTFKNSEANTAITADDKTGTATTTTIKGNTISTGKATMDFAEVLKDLGVRGDAKVDGKTTTGTLEVEGESQLKGNTIIGTAEKNANFTVNGNSIVSGNQTIGGTLDVTGISTFHDNVTMDKNLTVGGEVKAQSLNIADTVKISKDGIDAGGTKMYNVADGELASGSRDAVNGGQLYRVKQDLETQVEKVGANAAAMANLHPMDFDPDAKWNVAGALGNYGSETAAALDVFYRPNEDVMVNMSTAFGTGENMVGGGVSVRLGKGGRSKVTRAENDALKAQVDSLTARMDALLSVLNPNMSRDFPDVPENHWAYEAVSRLAGNGIVEGYPDGNFHGERTMSRYEMAEIIYNALSQGAEAEAELVEEFKPELQAMAASKQASAEDAAK